jgi:DNA invertase Pin-like site-specific DNA recombinase
VATRKSTRRPVRRAVAYVRISKDRDDETSTTTQESSMRSWCTSQGIEVVDVIVEPGRSAFKASRTSRPGMRKAMALIEAGAVDAFVCWKLDRAARNTLDLLHFVQDDLRPRGVSFVSVTEQFDTSTPTGELLLTILVALAKMESATKSERVEAWQTHRRVTGATPTGPRPYGYRRERNRLIVDEGEAAVVKEIAAAILAGDSLRSIVRRLNGDGLVGKTGQPFNPRGVAAIMRGPTIAGLREIDGTYVTGSWDPILDRQTWDDVRAVLLDPKRDSGGSRQRRWLLSGLALCGRGCGPMGIRPHRRGPRYACDTCHLSINAPNADEAIERAVLGLLDVRTWRGLRRRGRHVDTSALEDQLIDLAHQRANHEITDDVWKIRNAGVMADIAAATAEPVALPDVDDIRAAWPGLPVAARRLVVAAALADITIGETTHRGVNRFDPDRVQFTFAE